jgi:hypothetical protein
MAGLTLRAGLGAGMNPSAGGGLTPMPAQMPTGPRTTTNWRAFGYSESRRGPRTAVIGGVAAGVASAVLLAALWYALPR